MSVINQLLLDLEKRRASGAERSTLPSHVRALPDSGRALPWAWIAGGVAAAAGVAGAASWMLLGGFDAQRGPAASRGAERVIEQVVAASAGVTLDARPVEGAEGARPETLASRLSFELSSLPAAEERPAARAPLPTSRVVGREPPAAGSGQDAPPVAAKPVERVAAARSAAAPAAQPEIRKELRQPSPRDLAEQEYRKGAAALHQGRLTEAQEGFQAALNLYPGHLGARQALVGVLIETRQLADAERLLQEGLALAPAQAGFAMTLARLQVDRGDGGAAIATLRRGLEHVQGGADYVAFLAALLQRQGRHEEAIEQFQSALRARPAAGVWWLGLAISLQAMNRAADAQEAYRRARAANNLSPELAAFAEQRLKQLP